MTTITDTERKTLAKNLANQLVEFPGAGVYPEDKAGCVLSDGRHLKVSVWYDEDANPFNDYGNLGDTGDPDRWTGERPDWMDDFSVKLDTRHGPIYWQPPMDYEPEGATKWMLERVQGWFYDHWTYIGLTITLGDATAHIGGIETDSGVECFEEIIGDQLYEVLEDPASTSCPCCGQSIIKEMA